MHSDLLISEGTYTHTIYFGIILLSALHGYKPFPESQRTIITHPQDAP